MTFTLTEWVFTGPDGATVKKTAIYDMTEAEARESLRRSGTDVTGWSAKLNGVPVGVIEELPEAAPGKKRFRVELSRTMSAEIVVDAVDAADARTIAMDEFGSADFSVDSTYVESVREVKA